MDCNNQCKMIEIYGLTACEGCCRSTYREVEIRDSEEENYVTDDWIDGNSVHITMQV